MEFYEAGKNFRHGSHLFPIPESLRVYQKPREETLNLIKRDARILPTTVKFHVKPPGFEPSPTEYKPFFANKNKLITLNVIVL